MYFFKIIMAVHHQKPTLTAAVTIHQYHQNLIRQRMKIQYWMTRFLQIAVVLSLLLIMD